ncbi:hypothetical protein G6F56_010689 [Rhizopus delemar]|nr:hypothetical protein G6F56_010689 [Rhizopus delemar]
MDVSLTPEQALQFKEQIERDLGILPCEPLANPSVIYPSDQAPISLNNTVQEDVIMSECSLIGSSTETSSHDDGIIYH